MLLHRAGGLVLIAACLAALGSGCQSGGARSHPVGPDAGGELPTPDDSSEATTPHRPGDPATETNVAGTRCDTDADCNGGRVCLSSTCMPAASSVDAGPDAGAEAGADPMR